MTEEGLSQKMRGPFLLLLRKKNMNNPLKEKISSFIKKYLLFSGSYIIIH